MPSPKRNLASLHFIVSLRRLRKKLWLCIGLVSLPSMHAQLDKEFDRAFIDKKSFSQKVGQYFLHAFPYVTTKKLRREEVEQGKHYELILDKLSDRKIMGILMARVYSDNPLVNDLVCQRKPIADLRTLKDLQIFTGTGELTNYNMVESLNVTKMSLSARGALALMLSMPTSDRVQIKKMQDLIRFLVENESLRYELLKCFNRFKPYEKSFVSLSSPEHRLWSWQYQKLLSNALGARKEIGELSNFQLELNKRLSFDINVCLFTFGYTIFLVALAFLGIGVYFCYEFALYLVDLGFSKEKVNEREGLLAILFSLRELIPQWMEAHSQYKMYKGTLVPLAKLFVPQQQWLKMVSSVYEAIFKRGKKGIFRDYLPYTEELLTGSYPDEEFTQLMNLLAEQDLAHFSLFFSATYKLLRTMVHYRNHHEQFFPIIFELARLEAIVNIAEYMSRSRSTQHKLCYTSFIEGGDAKSPFFDMKGLWNSAIPAKEAVANDLYMNGKSFNGIVIGGPNAGGKSSLLRGIGKNIVLAQVFGVSFGKEVTQSIFDYIITYLDISDNVAEKLSQYTAELNRIEQVIEGVERLGENQLALILFDEPITGTNPDEGEPLSAEIIKALIESKNGERLALVVISHYPMLQKLAKETPRIINYRILIDLKGKEDFSYTYKIEPGVSPKTHRVGLRVLYKREGIPDEIKEKARKKMREISD